MEASDKHPPRKSEDDTSHQRIKKIRAMQRCIAAGLESGLAEPFDVEIFLSKMRRKHLPE
ncbi:MAG TPA: hypothetical protein DCG58_15350 [Hyphomonas adhaerens]|uniref:Transcriptional regulator n=1 Tax=Hyphomonas adhaerens TaxID=81029 RepID=A0A3B9H1J7_9PROT|nr:hypothetical protein [Hyphomonas adhaerens]